MRLPFTACSVFTLGVLAFAGTPAAAQQPQDLQRVKDLYSQASYEDALGVLSGLGGNEPVTEVARYRAACLLALGRTQDAKAAVAEIVLSHPEYVPDGSETSPRVVELFRAARRATVPGVARALYAEARAAMDRQDLAGAVDGFERVLRLTGDPALADDTALSDMKLLATDFLELARMRLAKAPAPSSPPAPPVEAPKPAGPVTPAGTRSTSRCRLGARRTASASGGSSPASCGSASVPTARWSPPRSSDRSIPPMTPRC